MVKTSALWFALLVHIFGISPVLGSGLSGGTYVLAVGVPGAEAGEAIELAGMLVNLRVSSDGSLKIESLGGSEGLPFGVATGSLRAAPSIHFGFILGGERKVETAVFSGMVSGDSGQGECVWTAAAEGNVRIVRGQWTLTRVELDRDSGREPSLPSIYIAPPANRRE